ncbi:hypothetical protein CC1G_14737 [Coprinopsis cinerea okayama7|uniref:Uncharacterized protein n=1 Tax=Coprinopsis cinerea (strain Okayama-7 / 130 / ATCC MYA-4618 / FGSC 9003) TaxID=240176 RepID=D6RMM8_COPC7|nr:hypothetical protein CC1G_14737 [Coprinopsis cinerea okayama7\|eukprot:XP_002911308.1 hypothetical protein CC1G_14737 [Coprinopsis cinerea okayama7\
MAIYSYTLSLAVVEYQTAVLRGDTEGAKEILESGGIKDSERSKVARFLEARGAWYLLFWLFGWICGAYWFGSMITLSFQMDLLSTSRLTLTMT